MVPTETARQTNKMWGFIGKKTPEMWAQSLLVRDDFHPNAIYNLFHSALGGRK